MEFEDESRYATKAGDVMLVYKDLWPRQETMVAVELLMFEA
jgi:hypothetical protein